MFEIIMLAAAVSAMAKIADADDQSAIIWGAITLAVCVLCFAIPFPMVRIGIGFAISLVMMVVYKMLASRSGD